MENVAQVLLPLQGQGLHSASPKAKPGASTQALFYAVAQATLTVFPAKNFATWATSYISVPSEAEERCWSTTANQYFYWDPEKHVARWCLPPELRLAVANRCSARSLVFVADQGSTG
eukprot:11105058-Lingulodinium_polyedra.AAC.1